MAPLYKEEAILRGYADDGCLLAQAPTLGENIDILASAFSRIQAWCSENSLALDLGKTGLQHFYRGKLIEEPPLPLEGESILSSETPLRWLGLYFDRKLSFHYHIQQMVRKGYAVISGILRLGGCYKGAPIASLLLLVKTCFLTVVSYGATTWWPPLLTRTRRVRSLIRPLEVCYNTAIRAILPIYRTTPIPLLYTYIGAPTITDYLDDISSAIAIRSLYVSKSHPLAMRDTPHILALDYSLNLGSPISLPPSQASYRGNRRGWPQASLRRDYLPKDLEILRHKEDQERYSEAVWVYSDGSKLANNRLGAGWAILDAQGKTYSAGCLAGD